MSILEELPHRCTIRHRINTIDDLGGNVDSMQVDATNVECWEQTASSNEKMEWQKRGISVTKKVYFTSNPNVTSRHQILVTHRNGDAVANPVAYDVLSYADPDASAGLGVVYRVMLGINVAQDE